MIDNLGKPGNTNLSYLISPLLGMRTEETWDREDTLRLELSQQKSKAQASDVSAQQVAAMKLGLLEYSWGLNYIGLP